VLSEKIVVLQKKRNVGHDYHRYLHALESHFMDPRKLPRCPSFLSQFCLLAPRDAHLWLKYVADNLHPDSKYTAIISRRVRTSASGCAPTRTPCRTFSLLEQVPVEQKLRSSFPDSFLQTPTDTFVIRPPAMLLLLFFVCTLGSIDPEG